jgi:signal transduction histidine kinase
LQYINEKAKMRIYFDKELYETQQEIQEQTLKNISQEIHDNIGQGLSLAKLNINTMDAYDAVGLQDKISASKHLITKAIQDLRALSKSLNTDYVTDLGLLRSVEYELEMIQKSGGYVVQCDVDGQVYRLDPKKELIIFRIVQEVLQNIIRHAEATAIEVRMTFDPKIVSLQISDNGKGFDASQLGTKNYEGFGLGLRNMHNRAKIIDAGFQVSSTIGKGTTVTVSLEQKNENNKI